MASCVIVSESSALTPMRLRLSQALHRAPLPPARPFSSSALAKMKVVPVPVREDNYAYLLIDDKVNKALAVDAYDVPKVVEAAKKEGVELVGKLTTHHHFDHSGGNEVRAQLCVRHVSPAVS